MVTIQCGGVKFPHTNPQIFTKSSTAVHGRVFTSILRRKIKNILSLEKYGSKIGTALRYGVQNKASEDTGNQSQR